MGSHAKRAVAAVAGGVLLAAGVALLVLPGPGLLLVLAGLIVLSTAFPALERHVGPVRARAMKAAEDSVSSPLRIAFSVATGLALYAAGAAWWLVPELPFSGWPTGVSLVLSGTVLLVLLGYSYRQVARRRREEGG